MSFLYYILFAITLIICIINKNKLASFYLGYCFIIEILVLLKNTFTHYPKPYEGIAFILFGAVTGLSLSTHCLMVVLALRSFYKKIFMPPIFLWLGVLIYCLINYLELRGQAMLNIFYSYYLAMSIFAFFLFLSKMKERFSFGQGVLFLSSFGSIITSIIAIKEVSISSMSNWALITLCNCIFYFAIAVASMLNRFAKRLAP